MEDNGYHGSSTVGGVGFLGLLTIVFIVLKLCKVINWSWIWVLSPLWIGWLVVIILLGIFAIYWHFINK